MISRTSSGGFSNSIDHAAAGYMAIVPFDTTQITSPQNGSNPQPGDPCHPITAKGHAPAISTASAVRRLTPTECERLQGFPDGYTLIPYRGKPASDGPRYKALGNSMAVPVMRWIGERIQMVEDLPC
jgi:DNA (cytosine-5)-methyltransferase 1